MSIQSSNSVQDNYYTQPFKAMLFGGAVIGAATVLSAQFNLIEINSSATTAIAVATCVLAFFSSRVESKKELPAKNFFSNWPGTIPVANLRKESPREPLLLQSQVLPKRRFSRESKMLEPISTRRKYSQEPKMLQFDSINDVEAKVSDEKLENLRAPALERVDNEVSRYKKLMDEEVQKLTKKFESIYSRIKINRKIYEKWHFTSDNEYYLNVGGQKFSVSEEMSKCDNVQQLEKNIDEYVFSIFTALKTYTEDYVNTSFSLIDSRAEDACIWINKLENEKELDTISKSQIDAPVINISWEGLHKYLDKKFSKNISEKIFFLFLQK